MNAVTTNRGNRLLREWRSLGNFWRPRRSQIFSHVTPQRCEEASHMCPQTLLYGSSIASAVDPSQAPWAQHRPWLFHVGSRDPNTDLHD